MNEASGTEFGPLLFSLVPGNADDNLFICTRKQMWVIGQARSNGLARAEGDPRHSTPGIAAVAEVSENFKTKLGKKFLHYLITSFFFKGESHDS